MSRKPIIAGNWKMNNTKSEAKALVEGILEGIKPLDKSKMPDVILAPTYTALWQVQDLIKDEPSIALGAQNVNPNKKGAYTGEISIDMLNDFSVKYIIIGHSERRQLFHESDEFINEKARAIIASNLIPIICCGETLEQREAGITDVHLASQITKAYNGISKDDALKTVVAYEPIWAIGTGKTCDAQEANRTIGEIRKVLTKLYDEDAASKIRILYGGSVKPSTIVEQMAQEEIDGGLIGGASLEAQSFVELIKGAM